MCTQCEISLARFIRRFTALGECLLQVHQQLKKLLELEQKYSYPQDPITLSRGSLEERALTQLKTLITK